MRKRMVLAAAVLGATITGTAGGVALASGDDGDVVVTGPEADAAVAAALDATGGGMVITVEPATENGATWEVEVTTPDGVTVDVRLDDAYELVVIEGDSENG